jgi:hypothetical protein
MLVNISSNVELLGAIAALAKSADGKAFAQFLRDSFHATAQDVIRRVPIEQIHLQHGYMQCCDDLILLFQNASDLYAQASTPAQDDTGFRDETEPSLTPTGQRPLG